jgi:hypothetical protein
MIVEKTGWRPIGPIPLLPRAQSALPNRRQTRAVARFFRRQIDNAYSPRSHAPVNA